MILGMIMIVVTIIRRPKSHGQEEHHTMQVSLHYVGITSYLLCYCKATAASNKVVIWEIIASFIPPACSYLFGTGLIDELNNQTSGGGGVTEQYRILRSSLYALAILSLRTIGSYLTTQPNHCGFSVNCVPTGLARAGLRDTLFHRMRHLKSTLNDKITPGGASGIIVDKAFGELRRSILNVHNVYISSLHFLPNPFAYWKPNPNLPDLLCFSYLSSSCVGYPCRVCCLIRNTSKC